MKMSWNPNPQTSWSLSLRAKMHNHSHGHEVFLQVQLLAPRLAAATPFMHELRSLLASHARAQPLRQCCQDLGLELPCPNDVEYRSCEMRRMRQGYHRIALRML